jgi:CRISPR/Cas system-associated exonuclease Cas4 (RecB family)
MAILAKGVTVAFQEWLAKYRVKSKRDGDGRIASGRYGYIGEYRDGSLCLALLATPRNSAMSGALNNRKSRAKDGGMTPMQVSEHVYESMWSFDGNDARLSQLAIELVHPKRRRVVVLSDERRAELSERLQAMRRPTQIPAYRA